MTKYNGVIKNLLQGVSQQARIERRPEQLEEQINCVSSITKGLGKRPGTRALASKLVADHPSGAAWHSYDRGDTNERYTMTVTDGELIVTDLEDGADLTVDLHSNAAYLASSDPRNDFRLHTVADTTFILNKDIEPTMGTLSAASTDFSAIIYCRRASWGFTYQIKIGGTLIAETTTASTVTLTTSSTTAEQNKAITLKTSDVIDSLMTGATVGQATWNATGTTVGGLAAWATTNSVTATQDGDVISLYKAASTYTLEVYDANHNNDLITFQQEVDKYDKLPPTCKDGYKVKVSGVDNSNANDYYVEFNTDNSATIGHGVWKECVGFGVNTTLTASTMPHTITREWSGSTATFHLRQIDWVARAAGDDDSNPEPSFVGYAINDLITYQGRMVLLTEENVCASVTFDHYNFFADSVMQESDADPIDTASSDNQVTNLHNAVIFNSSLFIFSDRAQFMHPSDKVFTSKEFSLASKSRYQNNILCDPKASASSIFFPFNFGDYTGIRELYIDASTGNLLADRVTDHVDHYIEERTLQIEASTDYDILLLRPEDDDATVLYVYEWFIQENKKRQSAWHTWDFNKSIRHMSIVQDSLYLWVVRDSTNISIEVINLADENTGNIDYPVRLDLGTTELSTAETIAGVDYWKVSTDLWEDMGYTTDDIIVIANEYTDNQGASVPFMDHPSAADYILVRDADVVSTGTYGSNPEFFIGVPYTAYGIITNPYVRAQDGTPKTADVLRLSNMGFNITDTGWLEIDSIKPEGTYTALFNRRVIDNEHFTLDTSPVLLDTQVAVPIRSNADRVQIKFTSDSHLPFNISSIDWTGEYYESGRRTI